MTSNQLRQLYLDFFKSKNHAIIPSASLIPENDPTVLFTTAGMHPLVPYLMGETHPEGKRLANCQKCIRTTDIDDVGDNRHLTFFEMLGNWSLGDYFKRGAIEWSWEFLTDSKWLGLDPKRIYVTVFMGDENSPIDQESINIWKEQFAKAEISAEVCSFGQAVGGNENLRIFPLPAKDNWWGPAGQTGPCGPCTEMFYDVSPEKGALKGVFEEEVDNFRIMEIWNDVFMEFNKNAEGSYEKMPRQNVDTGMGLERTLTVLTGKKNVFDTEFFVPLFEKIEELSGKKYGESEEINRAMRIIADHLKAATFILGDDKGVTPSNTGAGYILRRLIRRAVRYGKLLGLENNFTGRMAEVVVDNNKDIYPELERNRSKVLEELEKEESKFRETLEKGIKELERIEPIREGDSLKISATSAFNLYQTYGFPIEITKELAKEKGIKVDETGFNNELKKHQELSRTSSAGMFKGGLADASEETTKLHTASHLLLAALRKILGEHVHQKGSNITPERLRFDFSHGEKMTPEQIAEAEKMINDAIAAAAEVRFEEMNLTEAKEAGAEGIFESKYGERVKVYTVEKGGTIYSKEICGGPHVSNTAEIGKIKIIKEEASSSGVRRIRAVLE